MFVDGLDFIFCGQTHSARNPAVEAIARRVENFFLRDGERAPGAIPKFFLPDRRFIGAPCSGQELAYEIQRVVRKTQLDRASGRLVFAGTGKPLPPCWR